VITHLDLGSGKVKRITDARQKVGRFDPVPSIGAAQAVEAVRQATGLGADAVDQSRLMVFVAEDGATHLAWRVRLVLDTGAVDPADRVAFIDAHTGETLMSYDNLHISRPAPMPDDGDPVVGTGNTLYSGTVNLGTEVFTDGTYGMKDLSRGGAYTIDMGDRKNGGELLVDADNVWGDGTEGDRATVGADAHFGAAMTWDYYLEVHGRNGVFDDGSGVYSRVHYGRDYNNAYWSDSCRCMTYGDGDGTSMSPLVSLDVAGHEMTHGVTAATADLVYSGESGGINESISDIFGTAVEFYAAARSSQVPDYLIGEDVWTPGTPGDALRYMDHPTLDGRSIDHYSQYTSTMDVHYSSGLVNNVFYLMCEGGTNDTSGMSVTGIGLDKAEKIFYRALTVYMTSGTDFAGARTATVQAATDLYGSTTATLVAQAWTACGVS
jgi:Zn-dependent metalloprotease